MLEQRIQQHFFDSADLKYAAVDVLTRPIHDAAHALLGCITSGSKLLVAGSGPATALAHHAAQCLVGQFERERPPLAALALDDAPGSDWSRQVQALGHPGDLLLLICPAAPEPAALAAVEAAHDKEMAVVALTGQMATALGRVLAETDVHIAVPHARSARVLEAQLLVIHCLCDAVDLQLLGDH